MNPKSPFATIEADPKVEYGLAAQFTQVREQSESLAAELSAEDCMVQSMPDASPTKWHLAHTTWFWETFLLTPHLKGYKPLNAEYRTLFNSYYNAVGDRPQRDMRGVFSRPSLDDVYAYRQYVDQFMLQLLHHDLPDELAAVVTLGLNHEQQHQELIVTDIKHALWSNTLRPAYSELRMTENGRGTAKQQWLEYGEGLFHIGHDGEGFAFDNERPRHKTYIEDFQIASRLISNAEYMQFMLDGGYRRAELWLSEAWETVRAQGWRAPLYWERNDKDDIWLNYTAQGMRPVDLDEPVCHVSYFEADAFARWAGDRLPTEAEWEIAAAKPAENIAGNFLESGNFHPQSASHEDRDPDKVLQQMFGDCWEWTRSAYEPYPGYKPATGALGEYNGKFMCNQYVLRGGSCATPQSHIRATYRNFFPAHTRWQFSGIRLAKDVV
jgi:ergothioneine biosynthesis protein EgtB